MLGRVTRLVNDQNKQSEHREVEYNLSNKDSSDGFSHSAYEAKCTSGFFNFFFNLIQISSCGSSLNICEYLCEALRYTGKRAHHLKEEPSQTCSEHTHSDVVIVQRRLLNPLNIPSIFNQLKKRLLISVHLSWIAH